VDERRMPKKFAFIDRVRSFVLALVVVCSPASAMAQSAAPQQAEPHASVMQAVVVFLCVTLGMILVNRSAGRRSELLIDEIGDE
jgi:hypothetical protein